MTSVRMSHVFALEETFKGGLPEGGKWIAPPPGSYFTSTSGRQSTSIYTTGSKKWETTAYGGFSGTWEWTFMLDYNYLEPFMMVFDKINDITPGDTGFDSAKDGVFTFTKESTGRAQSFCVQRKILNRIAGGSDDETTILKGCVVQTVSFARSATTSQYQVTMSGQYADEEIILGDLAKTDYKEYDGSLVEYSCVLINDLDNPAIETSSYVANTDSVSVSITNNISLVYNTCTPFPTQYYEDTCQFKINTSCYSVNPKVYKTRVYSGGFSNEKIKPMSKGLKPMRKMYIASYTSEYDGDGTIPTVIRTSGKYLIFDIDKVVIDSMKWPNGDGSKLVDALSSTNCRSISMIVKNGNEKLIINTLPE